MLQIALIIVFHPASTPTKTKIPFSDCSNFAHFLIKNVKFCHKILKMPLETHISRIKLAIRSYYRLDPHNSAKKQRIAPENICNFT
nr:MAG TPA: hypothetical protein [Caudoviricetes sp.]